MDKTIVVALITLSGVIGGIIATFIHNYLDRKYKDKVVKKEKLHRQLEEYYRPYLGYLQHLKSLSKLLFVDKPENFRLLTYLLNKKQEYTYKDGSIKQYQLSNHDIVLMEQMFAYYESIEKLINEKSSLVDDKVLLKEYIPNPAITDIVADDVKGLGLNALLIRHFHLIKSASEGQIDGDEDKYASYVYPREINAILEQKIDELSKALNSLT